MRSVPLILLLAAAAPGLPAQGSRAVEMHQAVLDLGSNNVAMNISAHPDDEDGATLALVRMKQGARTHSVFSTTIPNENGDSFCTGRKSLNYGMPSGKRGSPSSQQKFI